MSTVFQFRPHEISTLPNIGKSNRILEKCEWQLDPSGFTVVSEPCNAEVGRKSMQVFKLDTHRMIAPNSVQG